MTDLPRSVHIMEVGPRDGLQIETKILERQEKLALIEALLDAGINEIEVGSFVNPKAVPQMADSESVIASLQIRPGVTYRGLWLNQKGLRRAIDTKRLAIDGVLAVTASDVFVRRNTGKGIEDTFKDMEGWIDAYREASIPVTTVAVLAAFGCNFEGEIPLARVISLIERAEGVRLQASGRLEKIVLADTMGWANPGSVRRLVGAVRERWPDAVVRLHLHDTRGAAIANAVAAVELGVSEFDAAIGGLGGCPFAGHKGAAGNVATEDLAFVLEEMGIQTGLDLEKLVVAAQLAEQLVGHQLPGKIMKGGLRSRRSLAGAEAAP